MRRTIAILFTILLSTGFLLPVAQGGWKWRGTNEPDTLRDVEDGLMWLESDTSGDTGTKKVYFNVFGQVSRFTYYNPNVAATGSRMQPPVQTTFTGLLGVWKDCNKDGYIGMSEYGLAEYRTELLLGDFSVCPLINVPGNVPPPAFYPHNDGEWIREFIFLGKSEEGDSNSQSTNPTVFKVQGTNIWGDWNLPGDGPRIVCPLGGNFNLSKTGHMVDYADCIMGYQLMNELNKAEAQTGLPVGGWDNSKPEDSPAFLNMKNPAYAPLYGENHDNRGGIFARDDRGSGYEAPAFYEAYDCGSSGVAGRPNPSGSTTVNPSGSIYETGNDTYNVARIGACKNPRDEGLQYPRLDGTSEATQPYRGKVGADHTFLFSWGNRRLVPNNLPVVGNYAPGDAGLAVERNDGPFGPAWRSNPGILTGPQVINRADLELASANYMTFYARVGDFTGLSLPSTTSRTYGSESCPTIGVGAEPANGWNCDPSAWKADCDYQKTLATQCRLLGETYHLRDIDCWDGQLIRTVPLYTSTALLSEDGPCEVPANEKPLDPN